MFKTNLTHEQKNKWLIRLRDPNSVQHRLSWMPGGSDNKNTSEPMCCLAHACFAVIGKATTSTGLFDIFRVLPSEAISTLINMNDADGKSLPEIADWIEENLETID